MINLKDILETNNLDELISNLEEKKTKSSEKKPKKAPIKKKAKKVSKKTNNNFFILHYLKNLCVMCVEMYFSQGNYRKTLVEATGFEPVTSSL